MNILIDQLARSILQKDTLAQCTEAELKQLTTRYPYFGALQLMLAKKTATEEQLHKTSLFFQSPLWLQQLLHDNGNAEIITPEIQAKEKSGPEIAGEIKTVHPVLPDQQKQVIINEETGNDQPDHPEKGEANIAMEIPPIKIEPIDPTDTGLAFEPYHTVDYFASQGIKFKEEEKPQDKFGRQLKSFTEWLKTMKRLPVEAIASAMESNIEKKVEQMAEHSLENREIITEAMAEVWEKQGNTGKAIEIYSKLSLLDPSKSSYFAAKIEALKKIN